MYFMRNCRLISIRKQANTIQPSEAIHMVSLKMPEPQTNVLGMKRIQIARGLISLGYCSAKVRNMELQEILFELQIQNYQPVLAHPERYVYLARKKEFFDQLKDSGCLFQLNLLSLSGFYGAPVQELAEYLVKKGYYDFAGTDLHNIRHLDALRKLPANHLKRLQDSGRIRNSSF